MITPDMIDPSVGNKKFWIYVKHSNQDSSGVAPLLSDDVKLVDSADGKAEILNNQFSSVFSKLTPLPLAKTSAQVLRNHVEQYTERHYKYLYVPTQIHARHQHKQ